MTDILALLQSIAPLISKTTLRQMSRVILGMLMMTGRVTMLGISRWTDQGGSYRTIQRLYHTKIPWAGVLWAFFQKWLWDPKDEYLLMDQKYLQESKLEKNIRTDIYQAKLLNKEFALPLNIVIILKTNLDTQAQAHVILFSTDLELSYDKLIKFYSLRFQIEFNFRDAMQYWGLEDFMNIEKTAVTNAANLAFFLVNLSQVLLRCFQQNNPDFSILDLKAHYHGYQCAVETIKMLPQKPDAILLANIFQQIARLGMIHPTLEPSASP